MKLITLNIWGGKLINPLLDFLTNYKDVDIFCFQEVFSSNEDRIISRGMHSNIFSKIVTTLNGHQGYFAPHLKGYDIEGKVDFNLEWGLAIFIKKDFRVKECKDIFIYRKGYSLENNDKKTIPRNLQYISFRNNRDNYLICNFHGLWYPKTKLNTDERLKQSEKITEFLSDKNGKKILCGDFNLLPNTKSLKILEKNMRNLIKEYNIKTTRSELYKRNEKYADYVLVSKDISIKSFGVINTTVSDHLPLLVEFS